MDALSRSADCEEIGRYAIFSEIASGATGSVHFARLRAEGGFARTVVVKRMRRAMLGDADMVAMFADEARMTSRIRHPNVVATLDLIAHEGEVLLVMEYVEGESLERLLANDTSRAKPVAPSIAVAIVLGFLRGLHAAHEATDTQGQSLELVHRDVSPANILVGVDGVARILDFGIAKATGRAQVTREGRIKGKLAYMPPEQLYGETLDRRTDVYAAGVVFWEMLAGARLFGDATEKEIVDRIVAGRITLPSEVSGGLRAFDAVMMQALAQSPDDRFETAEGMAAALEACASAATASEVGAWVESQAASGLAERARTLAAIEALGAPAAPVPVPVLARAPSTRTIRSARAGRDTRPIIAAALCGVGALAAIAWIARRGADDAEEGAARVSSSSATSPPTATATSEATPIPAATANPTTASVPPEPTASPTAATTAVRSRPARKTSPRPRPDECSMPYVLDSDGRKHYKPECLSR